ncbi:hypothetical protein BC941DRAFT_511794 [Chlamydoabsidia padenii]|nr:hypothetical protein BC941DRAFT_511794 [Chlamydoabsidia padenii]
MPGHLNGESTTQSRNVRRRIAGNYPRCGSTSHSRSTHRLCPHNARNQETQLPTDVYVTTNTSVTNQRCKGGGATSHGRRNHGLCQAKTTIENAEHDMFEPNLCHMDGPNYRRHTLPGMDVACNSWGSKMWLSEKIIISSNTNPVFSMCSSSDKISITLPLPPPNLFCLGLRTPTLQLLSTKYTLISDNIKISFFTLLVPSSRRKMHLWIGSTLKQQNLSR